MLNENFVKYENNEIGFSFSYPHEAEFFVPKDNAPLRGSISVQLTAQRDIETEFHDGLSVNVSFKESPSPNLLEQLLLTPTPTMMYPPEGQTISAASINGKKAIKTTYCCYVGETTEYRFLTRSGKYDVSISFFPVGPERDKFQLVASKILESIRSVD